MNDCALIAGGAGFIGCNFVRRLLAERPGWRVVVLDLLTYAGHRANLEDVERDDRLVFVEGDIADRELVGRLLAEHDPRWVVNFAAESHVDRSIDGPRAFAHSNTIGVLEMLEACRAHLGDAEAASADGFRFLQVSTDEVYGSLGADGAFTEDSLYRPNSPYAATKAGADHLVRAWGRTYGLSVLLTNTCNNYGPYQFPEKLIPLTILNAVEGRPLPVYGDGSNVRDWIHVEDHCDGVLAVLERAEPGARYNIGANAERTNLELVHAICDQLEAHLPAAENGGMQAQGKDAYRDLVTFVEDRPGHDRRYAIDASRIRDELDWSPGRTFDEGLRDTVAWYLGHADWAERVQAGATYGRERLGLSTAPRT